MTERALARRYIRESRETSTLEDGPASVGAVVDVLQGKLACGEDKLLSGRVWVQAMDPSAPSGITDGDVVVTGNRADAQRRAIELGAAAVVLSNHSEPSEEILTLAREHGTTIVVSPLDTYVSGRMITLAAPCRAFMERDPLTVTREDLVDEVSEQIKESHYGAAVVIDGDRRPIGLVTRSHLVSPRRRRVILVDHAEAAQSVLGIERAEIVEILDHHHIGSIETRIPVKATFDPVGSTSTLIIERFRQSGMEPSRPTAVMLLGAILSDTVILNSAHHDRARPLRGRVSGAGARARCVGARPADVRGHLRRLRGQRGGDHPPGRQALPRPKRPDQHRPDRGGRRSARGAQARAPPGSTGRRARARAYICTR